ncbi:MAG: hypothetical protein MK116_13255, partial [Phycisphaerales bacterium]|nr:hypothetical protein [Phycisphaerales bacterium]
FTDELDPEILDFFTVAYMWDDPGDPVGGNCDSDCDCNTNSNCFGDRYGCGWFLRNVCTNPANLPSYVYHTGGLPGLRTVIARFPDGVTVAAAVNTKVRESGRDLAPGVGLDDNIRSMVASAWMAINAAGGDPWPDYSIWEQYLPCGGIDNQEGDIDEDGDVDVDDLMEVIGGWGSCMPLECDGDIDGDDHVGIADLLIVLDNWGS